MKIQQGHPHVDQALIQETVGGTILKVAWTKWATCRSFRHSIGTHLLERGYDISTIQEFLSHREFRTTMIYTHVLNRGPSGVRSPADELSAGGSYADPHKM